MGILDSYLNDPVNQGLLGLSSGLLAAGGPSPVPVSFGQALGQGLQQGLQSYRQARDGALQNRLAEIQVRTGEANLGEMQRRLADQQAERDALRQFYAGNGTPTAVAASGVAGLPAGPGNPAAAPTGIAPKAAVWQRYQALGDALSAQGLGDKAQAYYALAEKYRPKFQAGSRMVRLPDGRIATLNMSEDGQEVVSGYAPAEKLVQMDLGGRTGFADPYSGKMQADTFQPKTMTPGEMASNAVAWANNRQSAERLSFDRQQAERPQFKDGYWIAPPKSGQSQGTVTETPLAAPPKGSGASQSKASAKALDAITEAEALLGNTTGSGMGALVDWAGGTVGVATQGAQNAAKLKALQATLMMAQPRMEGPQSDKDVALYREMAGQIGDSTIPVATRRAALDVIKAMHEKYAGQGARQSSLSGGGWSATVVK